MKVLLKKTENHMKYFDVELDTTDMYEYVRKAYNNLVKTRVIPEYKSINDLSEGSGNNCNRSKVNDDVITGIVSTICSKVIKEQNIETSIQPLVKTTQLDPLIFEMVIPLKPIVNLCDYHNIKLEPESMVVKKEEIDFVLKGLQSQFIRFNNVDRIVNEGDMVAIDLDCDVLGSNLISQRGMKLRIDKNYLTDLPDLCDQIIGMEKNEIKEFYLNVPENYTVKAMSGREVKFKVKINDIKETVLPRIDDEFANKVAPDVDTLDKLIDRIEKNIIQERKDNERNRYECRLMDQIIKMSQIEYPSIMVDMEIEGLINQYKEEIRFNSQNEEEYKEKIKQLSEVKLKDDLRPMAEKRVLWSIIINEVAKIENINISDKEIDDEIECMISDVGDSKEEQRNFLNDYQNRLNIYEIVKARKTLKQLTDIVKTNK
jgi:trigger factor